MKSVSARVDGIASITTSDSRQPRNSRIRIATPNTAMPMWSSNSLLFSAAVWP